MSSACALFFLFLTGTTFLFNIIRPVFQLDQPSQYYTMSEEEKTVRPPPTCWSEMETHIYPAVDSQ